MRNLLGMQRQIQDLYQMMQNQERVGKVKEVKFDKEKKRWFVKFTAADGEEQINTDWVPWKSFAHGTIQSSIPPRKDQNISLRSVGGQMEMAHAEPYHYDPDNKSPHDKEDEVFFRFNAPKKKKGDEGGEGSSGGNAEGSDKEDKEDPDQIFTMKFTKDGLEFNIGKTKMTMGAKGFKLQHDKNTWDLTPDGIKSSVDDGNSTHELTKEKVESKVGSDASLKVDNSKITSAVASVNHQVSSSGENTTGGSVRHEGKNIGKDHKHAGVMPGGGFTGDPNA